MSAKTGVLLINLGTPLDPSTTSVRRYLRQFLSDPRVLDLPALGRWLLLNLVILPFRPKQSAAAYRQIWRNEGSPLLLFTRELAEAVQAELDPTIRLRYAMRYQQPSIEDALDAFRQEGVERLVVFPMYAQYAASSTGSCLEEVYRICGSYWNVPALVVAPPFYEHPQFLDSLAQAAKEDLGDLDGYDGFLISFHGLPERQIRKSELGAGNRCLVREDCCHTIGDVNRYCYRAQCFSVARNFAQRLGLRRDQYYIGFQSRLGRTPWIRPYSDELLTQLPGRGIKKLAVMAPSFTADCLETLEEMGIRGRASFLEAGGEHFHLVPCLNAHPRWVQGVATMLRELGLD